MKPINVAVVFTCADTGKAYAIDLEKTQIGSPLILGMLSVEGPLHAVEVEPFVLRSKGISDKRAAQLLAMQELTDMRQEGEADGTFKHSGTHQGGTMRVPTPPQNLPRESADYDDDNDRAVCYQCGQETRQRLVGDEWHCKMCHAIQCERVRCEVCGKTCTRPGGAHYCKR